MPCCNIWEVFNEKDLLIKEYKYWKLLLRNKNITLGAAVLITKEHYEALSELNYEEMKEFLDIVKEYNKAVKAAFNHEKTNYLMLMMKDKHTHYHILPRYSSPRNFAGFEWTDEDWPKMTWKQTKPEVSMEILQKVKEELKKNL